MCRESECLDGAPCKDIQHFADRQSRRAETSPAPVFCDHHDEAKEVLEDQAKRSAFLLYVI